MLRPRPYSICVIGNSHAAAIKKAWENDFQARTSPEVSLTFFAARSQDLTALNLEDGALVPGSADLAGRFRRSSGGRDRIDIAAYDAFVLIGLGFRYSLRWICDNYGIAEHERWGPVPQLLSAACFDAMIEAYFTDNPALAILRPIRAHSANPVLICAAPYRTTTELESRRLRKHKRRSDPDFLRSVVTRIESIGSAGAARLGGEVLWQDEKTCAIAGYTNPEFSEGALRLFARGEEREDDYTHMNEAFGAIRLGDVLNRLDALSRGRVFPAAARSDAEPGPG